MSKSCCVNPIAKIIKVGTFEAGIVGLETALESVGASTINDEEQIKTELLRLIKEYGNYISPGTESDYKDALLREYRAFFEKRSREKKQWSSAR